MTVKEAYEKLGGNYVDLTYRVGEDMLLRLISLLVRDESYTDICMALAGEDYESAFNAAHTLKGIALNMGLTILAEKASVLTESLRSRGYNSNIQPSFAELEEVYKETYTVLSEVLDS